MIHITGYITMTQAQFFLQDLKLGHYLKVPPRTMFFAQCVAAFWSSIVQIAVMNWALSHIPELVYSYKSNILPRITNTTLILRALESAPAPKRIPTPVLAPQHISPPV